MNANDMRHSNFFSGNIHDDQTITAFSERTGLMYEVGEKSKNAVPKERVTHTSLRSMTVMNF